MRFSYPFILAVAAIGAAGAACGGSNATRLVSTGGDGGVDASFDSPSGADGPASSDAGDTSDAGTPADAADAGGPRGFHMASTGEQMLVSGPSLGLQLFAAGVTQDVDVTAMHEEVYGIPWDAFSSGTAPPPEWTTLQNGLATAARQAGTPVFLSLTMLDGGRQNLSPATSIQNGQVKTSDLTGTSGYDFRTASDASTRRAAYLAYVDAMVGIFSPSYLDVAVEVNLFFEKCPAAAPGLVDVINAVYDAEKAKHPALLVFPSLQIDHLYGASTDSCPSGTPQADCFDTNYAAITGIKRDRFAMSSYPYLSGVTDPTTLPADWFSRGPMRGGERGLISETGWLSTPLVAEHSNGTCQQVFSFDESAEASYMRRVLADADAANLDLVTWWADRDLLVDQVMTDCPCTFDATWCAVVSLVRGPAPTGTTDTQFLGDLLMKAFGTMGLRDYAGNPKATVMGPWSTALARPYAAH